MRNVAQLRLARSPFRTLPMRFSGATEENFRKNVEVIIMPKRKENNTNKLCSNDWYFLPIGELYVLLVSRFVVLNYLQLYDLQTNCTMNPLLEKNNYLINTIDIYDELWHFSTVVLKTKRSNNDDSRVLCVALRCLRSFLRRDRRQRTTRVRHQRAYCL